MGRTEFLTQRLEASPGWKAQTTHESEMALFNECTQSCARIVLDMADIVRDGDFATGTVANRLLGRLVLLAILVAWTIALQLRTCPAQVDCSLEKQILN